MGHLINPISFRLGVTSYWKCNSVHFFLKQKEFAYFYFLDVSLSNFLNWFFRVLWFNNKVLSVLDKVKCLPRRPKMVGKKKKQTRSRFFFYKRLRHLLFPKMNAKEQEKEFSFPLVWTNLFIFGYSKSSLLLNLILLSKKINFLLRKKRFFSIRKKVAWLRSKQLFPELSHFVIYHSGFYNVKLILYFTHKEFFRSTSKKLTRFFTFRTKSLKKISKGKSRNLAILTKIYIFFYYRQRFFRSMFWIFFFFRWLGQKRQLKKEKAIVRFSQVLTKYMKKIFSVNCRFVRVFRTFYKKYSGKTKFDLLFFYVMLKRVFFLNFRFLYKYRRFSGINKGFFLKFLNIFFIEVYYSIFVYKRVFEYYLNKYYFPCKFNVFIRFLENETLSSRLLFFYFVRNLKSRKPIGRIVNFVMKDITDLTGVLGFKILTSGRFTRKERAFYKWVSARRVPLSTYNSVLDYFAGVFKSRFGICGIKIWVFKRLN